MTERHNTFHVHRQGEFNDPPIAENKCIQPDSKEKFFAAPENPQTCSKLLQLPAEIRVQILELLLKNNTSLDTSVEHHECCISCVWHQEEPPSGISRLSNYLPKDLKSKHRNFSFHPFLLATCQALIREGTQILYHQNEVTLHFCFENGGLRISTFDLRPYRNTVNFFATPKPSLGDAGFVLRNMRNIHFDFHLGPYSSSPFASPEHCNIVLNFAEMCKNVRSLIPEDALVRATVRFLRERDRMFATFWRESCVSFVGDLRCKNVHFVGIPENKALELSRVMTSDQPFNDFIAKARSIQTFFSSANGIALLLQPTGFNKMMNSQTKANLVRAWNAAWDNDARHFADARHDLWERLRDTVGGVGHQNFTAFDSKPEQLQKVAEDFCVRARKARNAECAAYLNDSGVELSDEEVRQAILILITG